MTTADVGKHRALEVDPEEYKRCSELRKRVCPVFSEVVLDEQQLRTQWPERAVPTAILQGAQAMDMLHTFKPTLDGPATMKAATCNLPSRESDPQVVDDDDGVDATKHDPGDATEHAAEVQGRASLHHQQQVMLQSAPPPTYEVELLQIWARLRPVARISMATVAARRECRAVRATWALHCMALLGQHNLASCRGCGHYPTYRTCARCSLKWCGACHTWSQLCWKCYRPRHELNDLGEFLPGRGGPGGNGRFE